MDGSAWGPYRCPLEAPLGFHGQSGYLSSLCAGGSVAAPRPPPGVSLRPGEVLAPEAPGLARAVGRRKAFHAQMTGPCPDGPALVQMTRTIPEAGRWRQGTGKDPI